MKFNIILLNSASGQPYTIRKDCPSEKDAAKVARREIYTRTGKKGVAGRDYTVSPV